MGITSLSRNAGPTVGGSSVTVVGSEFLSTAECKFGTAAGSSSVVVSSTHLECISPSYAAAEVALEITNNAQDYTTLGTQYVFYGA